jgi:hypothetical protein
MTGHLWLNDNVWMYDEHQVFKDGRPAKLATHPVICESTIALAAPVPAMPPNPAPNSAPASADSPTAPAAPAAPAVPVAPPPSAMSGNVSCDDPEVLSVALKVHLNATMGHIDNSIVDLMEPDHVQAMGIRNNDGSKICQAHYLCNMDRAKQIEKNLLGQHPLTQFCYHVNQLSEAGNPYTIMFKVAPDGEGGFVVNTLVR